MVASRLQRSTLGSDQKYHSEFRFPAYVQNISIGPHQLFADELAEAGGADAGPNPYGLEMAALGACTSMTVRMYAERRTDLSKCRWA
jgi:uncharacterized OsmC-like protein